MSNRIGSWLVKVMVRALEANTNGCRTALCHALDISTPENNELRTSLDSRMLELFDRFEAGRAFNNLTHHDGR